MRVLVVLKVVNLKFSSLSDANLSTVNQNFLVKSGSRPFSLLWGFYSNIAGANNLQCEIYSGL